LSTVSPNKAAASVMTSLMYMFASWSSCCYLYVVSKRSCHCHMDHFILDQSVLQHVIILNVLQHSQFMTSKVTIEVLISECFQVHDSLSSVNSDMSPNGCSRNSANLAYSSMA
jgi:hypothetical protein